MHTAVQSLYDTLSELAAKLSTADDRLITEMVGWHYPALTNRQIAAWLNRLGSSLEANASWKPSEEDLVTIEGLTRSAGNMRSQLIPSLLNGNAAHAANPVLVTLSFINSEIDRMLGWRPIPSSAVPAHLARRLQRTEKELDNIAPDLATVQERLAVVDSAYKTADELPSTLQDLKAARADMVNITAAASESIGRMKIDAEAARSVATELRKLRDEASAIVKQCRDAYSITTTVGLARSFDERAKSLEVSLYIWVGGLAAALGIAMFVGWWRLGAIKDLLDKPDVESTQLAVQLLLSVLSVGAPIWFAWMATKQIGQRFRLAEDYAFKASVAKAYEGYRREAVRLDKNLEKALFTSALTRLDEAPLRFVEPFAHGSPVHELTTSEMFKDFLSRALGLTEKLVGGKREDEVK